LNFEDRHAAGFVDIDFHGQPVSHGSASINPSWVVAAVARPHGIIRWRVSCTK
jgi:hypothetical protein